MIRTRYRDAATGPVRQCPDRANPERRHGGWQAAPTGAAEPDQPRKFERTNLRARAITACLVAQGRFDSEGQNVGQCRALPLAKAGERSARAVSMQSRALAMSLCSGGSDGGVPTTAADTGM